jgi:hypothetical protein
MSTFTQPLSQKAQNFKNNVINSLSLETAAQYAPAIMADKPADYITGRYIFTPTKEVISQMQDMGYILTGARQASTKSDLRKYHGNHTVTFQHPDLYIKDNNGQVEARPQIVFMNSSDGSRPQSFDMGLFRLACANGLVTKSEDLGSFKERHTKLTFQGLMDLISEKVSGLNKVVSKINDWNGIEMSASDRRKFAQDALALRVGEERKIEDYEIMSVLESRRPEDDANNLWTVFNRVQENLIKGGFQLNERQARPVTNLIADMQLNKGIWTLAESFAN